MKINEAYSIVMSLARENALDPELHCDMQEEVERQETAFEVLTDFMAERGVEEEGED